jgi:protein associated with RNAse G/E
MSTFEIGRPIRVRGTSYDGQPHWQHSAYLVIEQKGLIVTQTFAGTEVTTRTGSAWQSPFDTRGHYWADRWYNVIRLDNPHGRGLRGFYCNVATPAEFDGQNLHYCDLQLDVRVYVEDEAWRCEVVDEDEFEEARTRLSYPEGLVREAWSAVGELQRLIEARAFPFNLAP